MITDMRKADILANIKKYQKNIILVSLTTKNYLFAIGISNLKAKYMLNPTSRL